MLSETGSAEQEKVLLKQLDCDVRSVLRGGGGAQLEPEAWWSAGKWVLDTCFLMTYWSVKNDVAPDFMTCFSSLGSHTQLFTLFKGYYEHPSAVWAKAIRLGSFLRNFLMVGKFRATDIDVEMKPLKAVLWNNVLRKKEALWVLSHSHTLSKLPPNPQQSALWTAALKLQICSGALWFGPLLATKSHYTKY